MKGLVLEGGGTKGAYQLGAYKALKELGREFDGIVGTSIGALNAAFIIQGDYDLMEDIWLNQDYKSFMIIEEDLYEKYKDGKYRSYYYADITLTDRYAEDVLYATSTEKEFFAETLKDYYMHKQYLSENYRDIFAYFATKGL